MARPDPEPPARTPPAGAVVLSNGVPDPVAVRALVERCGNGAALAALAPAEVRLPAGVTALPLRAPGSNVAALRAAVRWLRGGGRVLVLQGEPPGRLRTRAAHARRGRLIRELSRLGRAAVVPARVTHATEPAVLARLLRARPEPEVRLGDAIPVRKLASFATDYDVARYLQLRIGMLAPTAQGRGRADRRPQGALQPLAPAEPAAAVAAEIAGLPAAAHLLDLGDYAVYCARAEDIPTVLRELGRLRELTFRAAGEGTGAASDLDIYDRYYHHLFLWHRGDERIAGGYRLGLADEILQRYGKRGLYSHSLFRFRRRLIERLNPAIELGRSFVRPDYQRDYQPLMLLWRGIAAFVTRNPRYTVLFGPVSISADYRTTSQQLMVDFLTANSSRRDLAQAVRPRRPFRGQRRPIWRRARFAGLDSIDDVSELIAEIEPDHKGVPVLLRQYLKLGGQLLGFNVDDQFSDVLDGLIMVDLLEADRRILLRYFGRDGLRAFEAHHRPGEAEAHRAA